MTQPVSIDHDAVRSSVSTAQIANDDAIDVMSRPLTTSGLSPALADRANATQQRTSALLQKNAELLDKISSFNTETEQIAEEAKVKIGQSNFDPNSITQDAAVNDILDGLTEDEQSEVIDGAMNKLFSPGTPPGTLPGEDMPEAIHYDTPPSTPPGTVPGLQWISGGSYPPQNDPRQVYAAVGAQGYASGYNPQPGGYMTQADYYRAPNHEQLLQYARQQVDAAFAGVGDEYGDDEGQYTDGYVDPNFGGYEFGSGRDSSSAIALAQEYTKYQYVWGGGHGGAPGPTQGISDGGGAADANGDYNKVGWDCSGLARDFLYHYFGVDIGATTSEVQYSMGVQVSPEEAQPGDLFFPSYAGVPPSHVMVYLGDGMVVEASSSGTYNSVHPLKCAGTFKRLVQQ